MPAARGSLRGDRLLEPSGGAQDDQDARRRFRRGGVVEGVHRGASMTTAKRARAPSLQTIGMTKSFGALRALTDVSIDVPVGSFHALLGENGAGKSTLVKCIMGFYIPDRGQLLIDGSEVAVRNPRDAQALGVGMVYQHFTLVTALTAAENLVVSRADAPSIIDWRKERKALEAFLDRMPFRVPLDRPVSGLAAGEKQKLEILKLLYLDQRFLILDEPTSVLTPGEADEILGLLPGAHGAIAVLDEAGQLLDVLDMPSTPDASGRTATNAPLLAGILARTQARVAYCEFVGTRPTDAKVAAFPSAGPAVSSRAALALWACRSCS